MAANPFVFCKLFDWMAKKLSLSPHPHGEGRGIPVLGLGDAEAKHTSKGLLSEPENGHTCHSIPAIRAQEMPNPVSFSVAHWGLSVTGNRAMVLGLGGRERRDGRFGVKKNSHWWVSHGLTETVWEVICIIKWKHFFDKAVFLTKTTGYKFLSWMFILKPKHYCRNQRIRQFPLG